MAKRVIKDVSATGEISREKIESVVKAVHVAPANGGWQVRKSGKIRIAESFTSKEAAINYAKNMSRKNGVDLFVHSEDGTVKKAPNGSNSIKN